uniref:coiled-coil domain-containing protein 154-like n=1 Tax=Pristiophorus japonicus TaxID=55135 RepID=UPI00398F71BE
MKRQKNHLEYRISEVQTIVRDIQDQRDQTEQLISHLLNDLGQEKNKTDLQDSEIKLIKEEMKKLSKRMTDDSKFASLQKQNEFQSYAEQSCMHIKTTFEQRLLQIEDAFSYIKSKLTVLESEGRILEQRTNVRLSELASTITRQVQKREEDLQKLHQIQVENNHSVESEHVHLQGKIGQLVDSLSNKLFQKEIEFREEVHMKFLDLEKNLHRLQTMRSEHEKACWEECEKKRIALQQLNVEEIKAVSGQQPGSKVQEDFTKMDDDLKKLACSLANKMNWIEKVLKSEIHERDKQETQLENKMDDLHERVSLALVTLQEALGALQEDFINEMKKAATIQQKNAESNAKMKKEFHDRVWDIEQLRRIMGTLWADIHRTKEDSPGEIEKIKENLIDCSAKIKSLRDDLIKLKTKEKLEQENDTPTDSQLFVKEPDTTENKAINRWSVPQAMRRMPWRDKLKSLSAKSVFKRDEPQDKPHDEPRDKPRDEPRDKPRDEPQDKPRDEPQDEPRDKPRDEPRDKPRDEPPPDKKDDAA